MVGKTKRKAAALLLIFPLLWGGCSTAQTDPVPDPVSQTRAEEDSQTGVEESSRAGGQESSPAGEGEPPSSPKEGGASYTAPDFAGSAFHREAAQGENGVLLDLSAVAEGYVAVSARSEARLKFQVLKEDQTYTYDMAKTGEPSIFPLQCGNGDYLFRVMEQVGDKYGKLYEATCRVELQDEFQPFLRPSDYVNYTPDSHCVQEAARLAEQQPDAMGVVQAVFGYICDTVTYDKEKAAQVQSGYLPSPDETLETGKGICFDYASLAAAMLRSQGIPTKMVFGYVQPNDLYHAWNMFYTRESGWVTVEYQAESNTWNRLDLTFSANGGDPQFIGDGKNYTNVYFY